MWNINLIFFPICVQVVPTVCIILLWLLKVIKLVKACKVKEFQPDSLRIVLNIYDHRVAVSDQKRNEE